MAELNNDCCTAEVQASCCEPEDKAGCCGNDDGCGCGPAVSLSDERGAQVFGSTLYQDEQSDTGTAARRALISTSPRRHARGTTTP
jgi:hypothetical protein